MTLATTSSQPGTGNYSSGGLASLDHSVARHHDTLLLLGRLAMSFIFIESAITHSMNVTGFAQTFNNFLLPASMGLPMAVLACAVELLGGIALALGYRVRATCLLMIAFVFVTIFVGHRFWEMEGPPRRLHMVQVKKNVFMIGGFLVLMANGGGRYALSAWMARRKV
jgi:putative oxidoreductase